jgi:ring-1,2-phenylacetyl-CoA epoxidase subunit PaaD
VVTHSPAPATEDRILELLATVADPEIPAISVVDLGVIGSVRVDGRSVSVKLLPTFVGCPAVGVMQERITERLIGAGVADEVDVPITYDPPWTSDRITPAGRERLRLSGFAPPAPMPSGPALGQLDEIAVLPIAECPYCGSRNTTMDNAFGPTLCRAIYHCADCRQPFEQFKRV